MKSRLCFGAAIAMSASVALGASFFAPTLPLLPEFHFSAATAQAISQIGTADLQGKVWIADFVFTRCSGPCPMLSANMQALRKRLPDDVLTVSFAVDPTHDTVQVLKRYAKRFNADPKRWFFASGSEADMRRLLGDGFKVALARNPDAAPGEIIAHTTKFVLIGRDGRIQAYYDGLEQQSLDRLAEDAQRLSRSR